MKTRTLAVAFAGVSLIALAGLAANSQTTRNAALATQVTVPDRADNFRLVDTQSKSHELFYFKDQKAVVLIAHQTGSKHLAAAAPAIKQIAAEYSDKGVEVFLINSNPNDSREAINADLQKVGLEGFRVLQDSTQLIGESLGVANEAQAIVIAPGRTYEIAYHGPIDNRLAAANPNTKIAVKNAYLTDALDAVIAGKAVKTSTAELKSPAIAFPNRDRKAEFANISYSETIAPMISENCGACHAENGIAPFALNSYDMVKGFAPMIREVIRTDRMPPYNADPHVGEFSGDQNLSAQQMQTLVHWIEAGAPRGDGPDILKTTSHPAPEWELGEPDLIIDVPAYTIPASGYVDYQNPILDNPLTEGRWLKASTVNVGERQGVHHLLSPIGGYAVGAETTVYPENVGTWLEPGDRWRAQLHYTPFGREVTDKTQIGLYFYPEGEKPEIIRRSAVIANPGIEIPAGAARHEEVAYITFPEEAILYTAYPHAHYRGESAQVFMQRPGEEEKLILSLPKYDFNWQRAYEFAEPINLPAGTKIITRYEWDNSSANPANPDPTIDVTWGDQSFEEMQYTALSFRWADETSDNLKPDYMERLNASRQMGIMDSNIDGKVQKAEVRGRMGQMVLAQFDRLDQNSDGALDANEMEVISQLMGRRVREAASDGVQSN